MIKSLKDAFKKAIKPAPGRLVSEVLIDNTLMLRLLLKMGADPNDRFRGNLNESTALMWACWHRNEGIVKTLLAAGADPNLFGDDVITANAIYSVITSIEKDDCAPIISLLVQYGADVNAACETTHQRTPLCLAIFERDKSAVEALLGAGADPEKQTALLEAPLDLARTYFPEAVPLLEQAIEKKHLEKERKEQEKRDAIKNCTIIPAGTPVISRFVLKNKKRKP